MLQLFVRWLVSKVRPSQNSFGTVYPIPATENDSARPQGSRAVSFDSDVRSLSSSEESVELPHASGLQTPKVRSEKRRPSFDSPHSGRISLPGQALTSPRINQRVARIDLCMDPIDFAGSSGSEAEEESIKSDLPSSSLHLGEAGSSELFKDPAELGELVKSVGSRSQVTAAALKQKDMAVVP